MGKPAAKTALQTQSDLRRHQSLAQMGQQELTMQNEISKLEKAIEEDE